MNNIIRLDFKDYKLALKKDEIKAVDYYDGDVTIYTSFGEQFGFACDEKTAEEIITIFAETETVRIFEKDEKVKETNGIFQFPTLQPEQEEKDLVEETDAKNVPKMINKSFETR